MHPRKLQNPQVVLRPLMLRSQLFLLSPFRLFPLVRAPRISRSLLLSFPRKEPRLSQRNRPLRLAPVLFLSRLCCHCCCCCCFFFFFLIIFIHFFWTLGFVVMKFYQMNEVSLFSFFYITCLLFLLSLLVWMPYVEMIIYAPCLWLSPETLTPKCRVYI